ncbi:MAG: NADH-quinone oxidoreductase subunit J [Acidobacteria bacterium]|nr:NADH-quinone oxidoreductase subunit J [Acidobacteriota bacterium]
MELVGTQAVFFYVLALFTLLMALSLITAPTAVRGALFLMGTLIGVAGLFLLLHAEFVAGAQILIYVGGVVVLFIFVIMLVNVREEITEAVRTYTRQRYVAGVIVFLMVASVMYFGIRQDPFQLVRKKPPAPLLPQPTSPPPPPPESVMGGKVSEDAQEVGMALYTQAALPFEIASVLLLVAIIGSVVLARTRRQEETFD